MNLSLFNNNRKKVFVLLLILVLAGIGMSFVLRLSLESRVSTELLKGSGISEPTVVSVQPPAGTYEIENKETPLEVSMLAAIGCDIWYTDDGSNPIGWRVLDRDNPNLKPYAGYSISLTESTVFKITCATSFGTFTPVQTVRYTIVNKEDGRWKMEDGGRNREKEADTISKRQVILEDIRKLWQMFLSWRK